MLEWIDRSILDINSTMAVHFVIADGIVAMEGNGPLQGTARDPAWGREGSGVTNGQPMTSYTQGGACHDICRTC